MADTQDEPRDPVLVRPYLSSDPAGQGDRPEETWPEPATEPGDPPQPTAGEPAEVRPPLPGEAPGRASALRRQRLIVLAGVAVLALAGTALVIAGSRDDRALPEARPGPATTGSPGAGPVASNPRTAASRPSAPPVPSARATTGPAPARTAAVPAARGGRHSASPAPPPSATLAPPPRTDRTGAITSAGGRCLTLGGLLGIDGSPIEVAGCGGVSPQSFTLATDGTLRVSGRCAQVARDGDIRTIGCDDRESSQWRAGPHGSLVNPATGHCLTDPGTPGATVRAEPCTGAAEQRWTLP
ncbi:ricin-type beta-trefoil lectin domain protein [Actinoplanes sp. NPDC049681]|uniref:ricin-type beta-trefoil lectin domain protein n=1 Tax=Actinoplanes sp. NPDC049681 TaxID=3363905 RepID=UPI0037AE3648